MRTRLGQIHNFLSRSESESVCRSITDEHFEAGVLIKEREMLQTLAITNYLPHITSIPL